MCQTWLVSLCVCVQRRRQGRSTSRHYYVESIKSNVRTWHNPDPYVRTHSDICFNLKSNRLPFIFAQQPTAAIRMNAFAFQRTVGQHNAFCFIQSKVDLRTKVSVHLRTEQLNRTHHLIQCVNTLYSRKKHFHKNATLSSYNLKWCALEILCQPVCVQMHLVCKTRFTGIAHSTRPRYLRRRFL